MRPRFALDVLAILLQWLNNCVGKSNYRAFFVLLTCTLTLLVLEVGLGVATAFQCFRGKWAIATRVHEIYGGSINRTGLEATLVSSGKSSSFAGGFVTILQSDSATWPWDSYTSPFAAR